MALAALTVAFATAPTVTAATPAVSTPNQPFNFTVSPPSIAVETTPGVPVTVDVRIQNQSAAAEQVKATLMKFTAQSDTGLPNLRNFTKTDEFANWAQLSPTSFTAEPNVWTSVKLTITPPKDAAFGYYYAVMFSRQGTTPQAGTANLLGSVASLVLLDVKAPGAVRKANVAEFSTKTKSVEFLPVEFTAKIHNDGNTHVGVHGTISISKGGKLVDEIKVNDSNGYILPGSTRVFTTKWTDGTPSYQIVKDSNGQPVLDGQGIIQQKLKWNNFSSNKLRFGKYDARLVMIYNDGQGDVSTEGRLTFWVIPWRIIIPIAIVLLLGLAGVWALAVRPVLRRRSLSAKHRA